MSPDVRSLEGLTPENGSGHQFRIPAVAWEVKNVKSLPPKVIRDALQQARGTADGGPCALAMHLPGTKHWGIYIETSDWSLSDFGFESEGEISK